MDTVVSNAFHRTVDAPPEIAEPLLAGIAALRSLCHALTALGVEDRVVSVYRTGPSGFDLVWRLPDDGFAQVGWTATVEDDGEGRTLLSVAVRVRASDRDSRERVLAAWPVVGALVEQQTRRVVAGVAAQAERLAEQAAAGKSTRTRAAA